MLEFDKVIYDWLSEKGGIYRRYSDDMLFICKPEDEVSLLKKLKEGLNNEALSFQDKKTQRVKFTRNRSGLHCEVKNQISGGWNPNKNLTYLRFSNFPLYPEAEPSGNSLIK